VVPGKGFGDIAMPIYEYRCEACGHELEAMQKMSDAPLTVCEKCGKPALRKMISAAGFHLKGTGWYKTDFRDKGKSDKKTDKPETKAEGTKTKADTATAKKPATDVGSATG
jgi:putative FmdB family regulatory protein